MNDATQLMLLDCDHDFSVSYEGDAALLFHHATRGFGYVFDDTKHERGRAGYYDCFTKPYSLERIMNESRARIENELTLLGGDPASIRFYGVGLTYLSSPFFPEHEMRHALRDVSEAMRVYLDTLGLARTRALFLPENHDETRHEYLILPSQDRSVVRHGENYLERLHELFEPMTAEDLLPLELWKKKLF